jgi:hypothetical protein
MKDIFNQFENMVAIISDRVNSAEKKKLQQIQNGMIASSTKIFLSGQLIDHYIHDILDYNTLSDGT